MKPIIPLVRGLAAFFLVASAFQPAFGADAGIKPLGKDGRPLNLDFEDGTLRDWTATGNAFNQQPVKGDTVAPRRGDMKSQHQGEFWIGGYERVGDDPQGTLTSVPFKVTQPWCSLLFAAGTSPNTRVELVRADTQKVFFKTSGTESESLRPVVVNLGDHAGKEIFIRLVDEQSGHWGHLNFDNFVFHPAKPAFSNVLDPAKAAADAPPPADVVKFGGLSPEDAAREASVPPGFKLHLFAGEPDVKQPIAFTIDERGRVWVAEAYTYPIRAAEGQGKDRILVFEDTNGDHKFDRRTVFMEGLNLVSGLEVGFGGVWVGAAPHLMFIPIKDGDAPQPAGPPQILLDGWDYTRDTHETLNTFSWGPDGWLYGCHGVFCPSFVGKPGTPAAERQRVDAAVWRYHPTKARFEVFAEGTSNPWGVDFDENGQCIIEACVIPHFWHMIQGGRYERQGGQHYNISLAETLAHEKYHSDARQRHVNPFIYDDIKTIGDHVHYAGNRGPHAANGRSDAMGGGHAHAGLLMYLGESWPAQYRNRAFMNNIHGQRLNMDILERRGSGYVGRHGPDFVNFNDTWSQVLNMRCDQDGSVYILDWYDKNQCHHTRPDGHDRSNGRLFKLVYNNQPVTPVDLGKKTDDELLALVPSRNEWMSRTARRLLQERAYDIAPQVDEFMTNWLTRSNLKPGETPAPELVHAWDRKMKWAEWANNFLKTSTNHAENLRVLWMSHLTGVAVVDETREKAGRNDDIFRAWTLQLAFERGVPEDASLNQENIRRHARLGTNYYEEMLGDLLDAARKDPSPTVRLYVASALQRIPPALRWDVLTELLKQTRDAEDHNLPLMAWYAMEPVVETDPSRSLALAADSKLPRILNFTTRRVAAIGTPEAYAAITRTLDSLPDDKRRIELLSGLGAALKGQRKLAMPQGWDAVETKLAAVTNPELRSLAQSVSLTFGSEKALASLRQALGDAAADPATRRTALDSLLAVKDPALAPTLQRLLQDTGLRAAALRGLAGYDDPQTASAILRTYPSLAGGERRDALNTLCSRPAYARPLLAAIGQGSVSIKDLPADLIRQLHNLKDAEVETALTKVYGVTRESTADKKAEIERYKRVYYAGGSTPGDAIRGRVVFAKACQQCHTLFDVGGKVGPDITGSNRSDIEYILQNIVDPNAVIPNEYRSSTIETKDGRSLTGIIKRQDATAVVIATANEMITLPRAEVASTHQGELSMMPEGLLAQLADQEIRDLIYYLSRPGQVPLMATADTVALFFNGRDLGGWEGDEDLWKVENGEIVGRSGSGLKKNEFLKSQMLMGDFRLACKVKLAPDKENSGIQFRSEILPDGEVRGYQADMGAGWWGKLYEEQGRGTLWDKSGEAHVKVGDWNSYEIVAVGTKIQTFINGQPCVVLDDPKGRSQGIIALQLHAGGPMEVRFKDFQIELNPKAKVATAK
jgi:putative membrane-bound dehydrogenase-like protein